MKNFLLFWAFILSCFSYCEADSHSIAETDLSSGDFFIYNLLENIDKGVYDPYLAIKTEQTKLQSLISYSLKKPSGHFNDFKIVIADDSINMIQKIIVIDTISMRGYRVYGFNGCDIIALIDDIRYSNYSDVVSRSEALRYLSNFINCLQEIRNIDYISIRDIFQNNLLQED